MKKLINLRNNFDDINNKAIDVATKWGITATFMQKRQRKTKKYFNELCDDERLTDSEEYFKVNVFYRALDIIIFQLHNRFKGLKMVSERFDITFPSKLISATQKEIYEKAQNLVSYYEKDLSSALPSQLLSLRSCLDSKISSFSTVFSQIFNC